jgi:hypothetical protein
MNISFTFTGNNGYPIYHTEEKLRNITVGCRLKKLSIIVVSQEYVSVFLFKKL